MKRPKPENSRLAEDRQRQADLHHEAENLRLARCALDSRQIELAQDILREAGAGDTGCSAPPGFAWRYLWRLAHRDIAQLRGHDTAIISVDHSPDGRVLLTRELRGKTLIWDLAAPLAGNQPPFMLPGRHRSPAPNQPFWASPDGRWVVVADQQPSSVALDVFDRPSSRRIARLDGGKIASLDGAQFDTHGQRLALLTDQSAGQARVLTWNLATGQTDPRSWTVGAGVTFRAMPAAGGFVMATQNGQTRLFDLWTGQRRADLEKSDVADQLDRLFCFSADGCFFAALTRANKVAIWDTRSGRLLAACDVIDGACRIALSASAARLAMLGRRENLVVFDRSTGRSRTLRTAGGAGPPGARAERTVKFHSLSFSSDERLLAVGCETAPGGPHPPEVWDLATARRIAVFPGRNFIADVAFLPSQRTLVVTGRTTSSIWRLDPPREPESLAGHAAEAWASAFSPDGKILATGSDDTRERQTIKLWDPSTGRLLAGWKAHTATVTALAFSPDGKQLASSSLDSGEPSHDNLILWDVASHSRIASLRGQKDMVRSAALSPNGRWLASAGNDLSARIWNVADQTLHAVLPGHSRNLTSVAFSPDSKWLATGSNDSTVRLWDVASGAALATLADEHNVLAVAFAPDGSLIAAANQLGAVRLWSTGTQTLVRTILGESDQLRCLAFTPDGRHIVAAGQGKIIRIWDIATGQEHLTLEGHQAQINAVAFSPDASILASCSHDGAVKLWRAEASTAAPARSK